MQSTTAEATAPRSIPGPWAIAVAGAFSLSVAMGIGRFAFTPLLPMMLHDGVLDLPTASWLASANYFGYMVGAILCTLQPWIWQRLGRAKPLDAASMVRGGLIATCLLTAAMALPWAPTWPALRFGAGVSSSVVFVYVSGWCLTQLARRGHAELGGAIYVGPGAGIVVSGLIASVIVAMEGMASTGWLVFGVLAVALSASIWPIFRRGELPASAATAGATASAGTAKPTVTRGEIATLALAYGLAGFGYIITATFLPVIARQALPGSVWLDLFWPIFGAGVMTGAMLTTRVSLKGDVRAMLAVCYVVQAIGIVASLWSPTLGGFVLGSVLLGVPFTAITYFGMQEARRLRPVNAASMIGLLTVLYGLGQIVGPPLVAWLIRASGSASRGFSLSLGVAAGTLVAGALMYLVMMRVWPKR